MKLWSQAKVPLNDPAVTAQAGAVLGLAAGHHRLNAAHADETAVPVVVVGAIGDHAVGSAAWLARAQDRRT